ncbi:MAG: replicative DNA helicase [Gammaproteobacteria bacterium]|nr:replicative DNA helicase [Gammaproteobacteria bacterium]
MATNELERPDQLKEAPHSLEAEQAVLGGLMLNNDAWFGVVETLSTEDFYRPQHQLIFEAMGRLAASTHPFDPITLSEELEVLGKLDKAGGVAYLGELAENTPGASNVNAYASIVQERATLRRLIGAAQQIADAAYQPEGRDSETLLNEAERVVFEIADSRPAIGGPEGVKTLLTRTVDRIEALYRSGKSVTGLETGFRDLDEMTAGLQPGDLIVVAGRPSMGKTSLAMNIVEHAVMNGENRGPALVFSMEMPAESLMMRTLSSLCSIDASRMRTGQLSDEDWPRLTSTIGLLSECSLFIDDSATLTPNEIHARSRRVAREHGSLGLVVVDYLQLMRTTGTAENRATEIAEISRSLKALAREFKCPVVALSQLNRALENRPDKRPQMADLRESGAIEQDADLILFIYRDEVYDENSADKGIAEIIIGKQRNGPIGTIRLAFREKLTKFESLEQSRYEGVI